MPTIQEIINYAERKYHSSETDINKVSDLNDLHIKIYVKIARLKNEYKVYETTTGENQLIYSLPDNCSIDNIITVKISQSTEINSFTAWDECDYAGLKDNTESGFYYGDAGDNKIAIIQDGLPITTEGLAIAIFYFNKPAALTSGNMSAIPELHSDYHDLLKYGLIQELASQGHNPDTEIADYWQARYDDFMKDVEANLSDKYNKAPTQANQASEWW